MAKENISKIKMAVIAGAAEAIKHKANNPKLSDEEVLKQITRNVDNIINNID